MRNIIDLFKITKSQLGHFPSIDEVNQLSDKPSVILSMKNKEKRKEIEKAYERYLKCPNQSWYVFLRNIMSLNPQNIAITYRGNNITNEEATLKIDKVATKLYRLGIRKGDIVPVCMDNTPEFFYVMCALNLLGAKCNCFSSNFSLNKIEEIFKASSNKVLIATDNEYTELEMLAKGFKKILLSSRGDSIKPDAEPPKEYSEKLRDELKKYYDYKNNTSYYKRMDKRIGILFDSLLKTTPDKRLIARSLIRVNKAEDICSISYSIENSVLNAQEVKHSNSEIITGALRQIIENQNEISMEGLVSLVNIPNESYIGNTTQMLNILFQKGTIALEPQTDSYSFLESLYINKPNIVYTPKNIFINSLIKAKNFLNDGIEDKMPWLLKPVAIGTSLNAKEERALNSFLNFENAGIGTKLAHKKAHTPTIMSVVNGDETNGELFYSNYNYYKNFLSRNKSNCDYGLEVQPDIEVAVLDPKTLEELDFEETGLIVGRKINSDRLNPNNEKANIITDVYGRKWENLNLEGNININGNLNILGKFPPKMKTEQGINVSLNEISELALEIDRVFQACTYYVKEENCIVVNYRACKNKKDKKHGVNRFTPDMANDIKEQLSAKISAKYGSYMNNYIKIRRVTSFPLDEHGKESVEDLKKLGLKNTEDLSDTLPTELRKVSKEPKKEVAKESEEDLKAALRKNLEKYNIGNLEEYFDGNENTNSSIEEDLTNSEEQELDDDNINEYGLKKRISA